jgi:hypothetical protein
MTYLVINGDVGHQKYSHVVIKPAESSRTVGIVFAIHIHMDHMQTVKLINLPLYTILIG